jgi:hypothetical protein
MKDVVAIFCSHKKCRIREVNLRSSPDKRQSDNVLVVRAIGLGYRVSRSNGMISRGNQINGDKNCNNAVHPRQNWELFFCDLGYDFGV